MNTKTSFFFFPTKIKKKIKKNLFVEEKEKKPIQNKTETMYSFHVIYVHIVHILYI